MYLSFHPPDQTGRMCNATLTEQTVAKRPNPKLAESELFIQSVIWAVQV